MSAIAYVVGRRLRARRLRDGLTQEETAEKAGLHPTYVGQVERGEKNLTLESLEKICRALQLPLAQLFEGLEPALDSRPDISRQCAEMIGQMDEKTQMRLLRILCEICQMKLEK